MPATGWYCFGTPDPARVPEPAATIKAAVSRDSATPALYRNAIDLEYQPLRRNATCSQLQNGECLCIFA
jgi:hypothetical protein